MTTDDYPRALGDRLRKIRIQKNMSLQDVQQASGGMWKAAVVGAYERGDRNISASRLCELAEFYGVAPSEVLPQDDVPRPADRSTGIVIDLTRIDGGGERWRGLRRYCESIQLQRGDYNRDQLSIRGDDMRALSVILETDTDGLLAAHHRPAAGRSDPSPPTGAFRLSTFDCRPHPSRLVF